MKQTELLAPAKDKKTALAAINCGADAVYIGAPSFGARHTAGNSLEDIKEVVDYAHKFYAAVHVTVNTILTDNELLQAVDLINKLYEMKVDAIIIQDMGILELAAQGKIPPISLHMSTQCDNRSLEKAKFFDKLGVSRIIFARELSIKEIEQICKNISCEAETFIHGALCVSYSGQCYMSCSVGGRSANRGECAQPCRKQYTLIDEQNNIIAKNKFLLNLKDFNASKHIEKLVNAGVKSFKIEGRLKDINYVKNVVSFYRKELDKYSEKTSSGKVFPDFTPNIAKTFNRGFTDYFLEKRKDCYNFDTPKSTGEKLGIVTKSTKDYFEIDAKLSPQDGIIWFENGSLDGCLVNRTDCKKVYPNKKIHIKVGTVIYRNRDAVFEKQLESINFKRRIGVNFVFDNNILKAIDEDGNSVELKVDFDEIPKNPDKMKDNFINALQKTGGSDFYTNSAEICSAVPFMPVSAINELRRRILENLMSERLKNYPQKTQKALTYTEFPQKEADYTFNIHNKTAKKFYEKCGTKVREMSPESQRNFNAKCLMQTKHCLKYAFNLCKKPINLFLLDEKNKKYPLEFDCKNCMMKIYHP